jgi:hypothetical protein
MLWGKKIVEVVEEPALDEGNESFGDPYRGTVVLDTPNTPEESLARAMYNKAQASIKERDRVREEDRLILERFTIEDTIPYVLRKIDEYSELGITEVSLQYLTPNSELRQEYCTATLVSELELLEFEVRLSDHNSGMVNWTFEEGE